MKKKGFTLVELLAVIAILAILVIIALPNIMDLFNQAKKNSFTNEVKEIFKAAQTQWMSDSLNNESEKVYTRLAINEGSCDPIDYDELKLSGRSEILYGIRLDSSGNVYNFVVTDGTYAYLYNDSEKLTLDQIGNSEIADAEDLSNDNFNVVLTLSDFSSTTDGIECRFSNNNFTGFDLKYN